MTLFYLGEMREDSIKIKEEEKLKSEIRRLTVNELSVTRGEGDKDKFDEKNLKQRKLNIAEQTAKDKVDDQRVLVQNDFAPLKVGLDTYSMCFKALHR
jgi:hypothetical protein